MAVSDFFLPSPSAMIARALPGMGGMSPNPLAQAGPGGAPAGPPSPGPAGGTPPTPGPQGAPTPQAPPQPMAYQTPPDMAAMNAQLSDPMGLMRLYAQLSARQQQAESINRGVGLMLAGLAQPRDREAMISASTGLSGPGGAELGDLMRLYQMQYQMQQQAMLMNAAPSLAKQLDVPVETAQAIIASGKYGDVETALAGLSGDPSIQEMKQARKAWVDAHPGEPVPLEYASVDAFRAAQAGKVTQQQQLQKDLAADRANFAPAVDAYDRSIADLEKLKNMPGLPEILGSVGQYKTQNMPGLSSNTSDALALYNKIMGGQYAAGVQDFKGAGRITQQELKQDLPSQSTMPNRNTDPGSFVAAINDYEDKLKTKRAQVFGQAGQLSHPDLSDQDYARVSQIYKPGGDLYVPGQAPRREAAGKPLAPDDLAEARRRLAAGDRNVIPYLKGQGFDTSALE